MRNNTLLIYFILTIDYEMFGDGSGCVENCVIKPAEKIMNIAEKFNAPVTFFVDALEFIIMEKHLKTKEEVLKVKKQLKSAVSRGHDVQLHLHPQWQGAYWEEERWRVNMTKWRVGDLPYEEILELLKQSKCWLETLLKSVKSDYKCVAFRAGGWCIQPSANVIRALKALDIQIDSTVAPGIKNFLPGEWCDFTCAPNLPYWKTNDDVCNPSKDGIWEIPITTGNIGKFEHLRVLFNRFFIEKQKFASGCIGSYKGPDSWLNSKTGKLLKLSQLGKAMLDICTIPDETLKYLVTKWIKKFVDKGCTIIPIVSIGHTKNFTYNSEKSLYNFLYWLKRENIQPVTFSHLFKLLRN